MVKEKEEKGQECVLTKKKKGTLGSGALSLFYSSMPWLHLELCVIQFTYTFAHCRFMDSELDLNDEIQKLHVIATVPHLYQHVVDTNAVGTILGLLSHENSGDVYIVQSMEATLLPV